MFSMMGFFGLMNHFICPLTLLICLWRLFCIRFELAIRSEFGDDEEKIQQLLSIIHPARVGAVKEVRRP